jgi:transcriptional regulator with XRE-family HTH domain
MIGHRLRLLREHRNLSQGTIEQRTGLLSCYISRVENGHTIPTVETLEKMARGLEIRLYQLFYEGAGPSELPKPTSKTKALARNRCGTRANDGRFLSKLRGYLSQMTDRDRSILMALASQRLKQKMRENLNSR